MIIGRDSIGHRLRARGHDHMNLRTGLGTDSTDHLHRAPGQSRMNIRTGRGADSTDRIHRARDHDHMSIRTCPGADSTPHPRRVPGHDHMNIRTGQGSDSTHHRIRAPSRARKTNQPSPQTIRGRQTSLLSASQMLRLPRGRVTIGLMPEEQFSRLPSEIKASERMASRSDQKINPMDDFFMTNATPLVSRIEPANSSSGGLDG